MLLGKPTMRFHVFPRPWQGYQDSCHWVGFNQGFNRGSNHRGRRQGWRLTVVGEVEERLADKHDGGGGQQADVAERVSAGVLGGAPARLSEHAEQGLCQVRPQQVQVATLEVVDCTGCGRVVPFHTLARFARP